MQRTILGLLALVSACSAWADYAVNYEKVDPSRWRCRLCEFDKAIARSGQLAVGSIDAARGEPRFGRDTGIDRAGRYLHLDANWQANEESGTAWRLAGYDLGLDSRSATVSASSGRRYGVALRLAQLPRRIANDGRFPYRRLADQLVLPSDWRRGFATEEMAPLQRDDVNTLASERRQAVAMAWLAPTPRTQLRMRYSQEHKSGTVETYRDAFYQATALPQPIAQRTEEMLLGWRYGGEAALLDASIERRIFANDEAELRWQNPYFGLTPRRSATAPDNIAELARVVSRFRLGGSTRLNATLVRGKTSQDAPFLPYTTNAALNVPLPAASLEGARRRSYADVKLLHRLSARLRLTLSYVADIRADRRLALTFAPVLGDLLPSAEQMVQGFTFRRREAGLRLRYRTQSRLRLAAGVERRDVVRRNLEIGRNREVRAYLGASRVFGAWQLRVEHGRTRRDAAPFVANTANNPLTRRYYQAQRLETSWQGWMRFRRKGFAAGLQANYRRHDYPDSELGLEHATAHGWNMDIAYTAGAASATAWYGVDRRSASTAGSAAFAMPDWRYHTRDSVATAGASFDIRVPRLPIDIALDYASSDGLGAYSTMLGSDPSAAEHFPSLVSRQRSLDIRLRHRLKIGAAVVAGVYLERYRSRDWAIDDLEPASIRNVLVAGRQSPVYANRLLYLSFEKLL